MYKRENDPERPLLGWRVANLTSEEAYLDWWGRHYKPHHEIDTQVRQFLKIEKWDFQKAIWLKPVRQALFLSVNEMAKRLGISASAYCKIEKAEAVGRIQLGRMVEVADAMNCELIYAIRPKKKLNANENMPFSRVIWDEVYPLAKEFSQYRNKATVARLVIEDKRVRELMKWNMRSRISEKGIFRIINRLMIDNLLVKIARKRLVESSE
jgi:transcriptional regulator with XRE-family HTH domain